MSIYKDVFDKNIVRVNTLCHLYESIRDIGITDKANYQLTDILRLAVVLLHSSFEEYFRSVLCTIIPNICDENDLKNISFAGSKGRHKNKITIGQLLCFKGMTVERIIYESVFETYHAKALMTIQT